MFGLFLYTEIGFSPCKIWPNTLPTSGSAWKRQKFCSCVNDLQNNVFRNDLKRGKWFHFQQSHSWGKGVSVISDDAYAHNSPFTSSIGTAAHIPKRILHSWKNLRKKNPFIYDHHLFWLNIHTVINQPLSPWWYQFATSCNSCKVTVSLGVLKVPCIHMHKHIWMDLVRHHII